MYTKQTTYEEVMTLEEAREIIRMENKEKREACMKNIQKAAFFLACIIGGIAGGILTEDATPLFLWLCALSVFADEDGNINRKKGNKRK